MPTVDTLINALWVIPVEPDGQTLDHHSIVVHSRNIAEVLATADATRLRGSSYLTTVASVFR